VATESITETTVYTLEAQTEVYTFAMPMFVYVQVKDVQNPAKILADSVEENGTFGSNDFTLTIKSGNKQVGKFRGNLVSGWWIQDEA
jgi:hypothetical protein